MHMTSLTLSQRPPGEPTILAVNNSQRNLNLVNSAHNIVGRLVGWLGFNGTFSTNRPYRAIKNIKVC